MTKTLTATLSMALDHCYCWSLLHVLWLWLYLHVLCECIAPMHVFARVWICIKLLYSSAEAGNAAEVVACLSDSSTSEAHSLRSFQSDSCDDSGELFSCIARSKVLNIPSKQPPKKKTSTLQRTFEVYLATLEKFSKCF